MMLKSVQKSRILFDFCVFSGVKNAGFQAVILAKFRRRKTHLKNAFLSARKYDFFAYQISKNSHKKRGKVPFKTLK